MRQPRRLFAAVAAILLGTTVAVTAAAPAAHAGTVSDFTLSWTAYPAADQIPMVKATMTSVFDDGNHQAVYNGTSCSGGKGSANPLFWYCFAATDGSSLRDGPEEDNDKDGVPDYPFDPSSWIPQGITSVSDALDDEDWNGKKGLLVGWYHSGDNGIRISAMNTATQRYRHLLLVNPYWNAALGRYDFKAVDVHAGGMVWYGDYLYVADTFWGIRVFSMKHIYDLGASSNGTTTCSGIGFVDTNDNGVRDKYCAATYKYAMVQVGMWQRPSASTSGQFCTGSANNPRFSYLSLDRAPTPDRLIVGEYCPSGQTSNGRVVAYNMNNGSTVTHQLNDGVPDAHWTLPVSNIQGAATNGSHFFLNQSKGHSSGAIHRALGGAGNGNQMTATASTPTPIGPEDLSIWRTSATLWSVTEHLHSGQQGRMIYAMAWTTW
ncbi:hypothetical protein [Catellatospora chokoriensis]|uniref:Secreted protein n=1 Tax=Catellatospora chokoriensis TaxID=310353 RepID=A0A8J3NRU6_9ACTN|nr:hypothetical protein [Catellatospora chokoriensis]GIF90325.1 hypothetical protein Cch02nite_37690 [Catellatospora chokoriensis]